MNKWFKLNIKNFNFGKDKEIELKLKYLNYMEEASSTGRYFLSLAWSFYKTQNLFRDLKII